MHLDRANDPATRVGPDCDADLQSSVNKFGTDSLATQRPIAEIMA